MTKIMQHLIFIFCEKQMPNNLHFSLYKKSVRSICFYKCIIIRIIRLYYKLKILYYLYYISSVLVWITYLPAFLKTMASIHIRVFPLETRHFIKIFRQFPIKFWTIIQWLYIETEWKRNLDKMRMQIRTNCE